MPTSRSKRRWAILAATGAVGLTVAATVAPANARTKTTYPLCNSVKEEVTFDSAGFALTRFKPSARPTTEDECMLVPGNRSDMVRYLQNAMNLCYGQRLNSDGVYGPLTKEAVRQVQQTINRTNSDAKILEDGIYGPQTRRWMSVHAFDQEDLNRPTTPMGVRVRDCGSPPMDHQYSLEFGRSGAPLLKEEIRVMNVP